MKALLITFSQTVRVICKDSEPTEDELMNACIKAQEAMADNGIAALDKCVDDTECPFGSFIPDYKIIEKDKLGEAYKEIVGYNPFEDDPNISADEVRKLIYGYDETATLENGSTPFATYFSTI
jgi:hypothetical protein